MASSGSGSGGGVLSFLFDGKPPPSVTTYGTSTTSVPQWLSDYTQGILGQANAVASQPYQEYGGPRIAGFTPEQQQAFALTEGNTGKGTPEMQGALNSTQGVLGQLSPEMIGKNLDAAGQTYTGDTVGKYMNPYTTNVTDRATELANRNFNDKLLPSIQNIFTRSGQYGSTRMADSVMSGARGVSEDLQSAANADLANAYSAGATNFGNDANRAGSLAQLGVSGALSGANQQGTLAQALQRMGLTDASALETVGGEQQNQNQKNLDLAYGDFESQRDYGKTQTDWLNNILHGVPNQGTSSTTSTTAPYQGAQQPSTVSSLNSLLSLLKGLQTDKP